MFIDLVILLLFPISSLLRTHASYVVLVNQYYINKKHSETQITTKIAAIYCKSIRWMPVEWSKPNSSKIQLINKYTLCSYSYIIYNTIDGWLINVTMVTAIHIVFRYKALLLFHCGRSPGADHHMRFEYFLPLVGLGFDT